MNLIDIYGNETILKPGFMAALYEDKNGTVVLWSIILIDHEGHGLRFVKSEKSIQPPDTDNKFPFPDMCFNRPQDEMKKLFVMWARTVAYVIGFNMEIITPKLDNGIRLAVRFIE